MGVCIDWYCWQYMKTTIEIPEALLAEAKRAAAREGTTLRALVETGLRQLLRERRLPRHFELRDASVDGKGLNPDVASGGWERIRAAAYEGRGG